MGLENMLSLNSRSDPFRPVNLANEAFFRLLAQNPAQQSAIVAKGLTPNNFSYAQLKKVIEGTQFDYLTNDLTDDFTSYLSADGTNKYSTNSNQNSFGSFGYVNEDIGKTMSKAGSYENYATLQDQQARELRQMEELLVSVYVSGILDYELTGKEFSGLDKVRARNGLKEFLKQQLGLTTKEPSSADYQAISKIVKNSTNYKLLETIGMQTPTTETYKDLRPTIALEKALEGKINIKYVIGAEPVGGPSTIALAQQAYIEASGSKLGNNIVEKNAYEAMQKNPLYRTLLNQAKELSEDNYHSDQSLIRDRNGDDGVGSLNGSYNTLTLTPNMALVNGADDLKQAIGYQPPTDLLDLNSSRVNVVKQDEFRFKELLDKKVA